MRDRAPRRTSEIERPREAPRPHHPDVGGVLALQRGAGNQAVARMLARTETATEEQGWGDWLFPPTPGEEQDTGASPGTVWRWLSWAGIGAADLAAEAVEACGFEGYDVSADFIRHYMSGRGADYELTVPDEWQQKIAAVKPKPGSWRDVSAYGWGIPDMKNSLGHFNLTVEKDADGGRMYTITDRYHFPAFVDGKPVHHGFEVDFFGKLPAAVQQSTNTALAALGTWQHPCGKAERFEIKPMGGKWTFIIPQQWLVDSGVDFNVSGSFVVAGAAPRSLEADAQAAPRESRDFEGHGTP